MDKFALTNAIYALDAAYQRFFKKKGGYPRFKSRHRSRMSYTTNFTNGNIAVLDGAVKLPKLGKIRAVVHRAAPEGWDLKQARVSRERDGSYHVSILYEYQAEIMLHFFRKSQEKLAKAQRKLKTKQLHSANYRKQQKKIARIARKTADQRKDFLHKKSAEIANQYDLVCVEDLDMRAMANRKFKNGKATLDNGYGAFLTMLRYKLEDRGKRLIRIDKWYPSSKTCNRCGQIRNMPLSIRRYECSCGLCMDRDLTEINCRAGTVRTV